MDIEGDMEQGAGTSEDGTLTHWLPCFGSIIFNWFPIVSSLRGALTIFLQKKNHIIFMGLVVSCVIALAAFQISEIEYSFRKLWYNLCLLITTHASSKMTKKNSLPRQLSTSVSQ